MPKKKKNPKNPALETISEESGSPPSGTSSEDDIADPISAAPGPKGPKEIQGSATSAPEGAKSPEGVKSHTGTNFPEGEQLRDETRLHFGPLDFGPLDTADPANEIMAQTYEAFMARGVKKERSSKTSGITVKDTVGGKLAQTVESIPSPAVNAVGGSTVKYLTRELAAAVERHLSESCAPSCLPEGELSSEEEFSQKGPKSSKGA